MWRLIRVGMAQPDSTSIVDVVNRAHDIVQWKHSSGKSYDSALYILPEFQRDFTWSLQQTLDLFDSLFRNVYIGSLVLGEPSFDIGARRVDLRRRSRGLKGLKNGTIDLEHSQYTKTPAHKKPTLILDGQQRISSLTRAMYADQTSDHVFFVAKPRKDRSSSKPSKTNLMEHLHDFDGVESDNYLCIEMAHVWKVESGVIKGTDMTSILTPLLSSKYFKNLSASDQNLEKDYFYDLMSAIKNFFNADKIVQVFELDTTLDNFTLFFERSNTRGVKLDFIDILAAKIYSQCKLRQCWETLSSTTKLDVKPGKEPIIRLINYFSKRTDQKRNNLIGKGDILRDLTGNEVNALFTDIATAWIDTTEWLISNKIIMSQSRMPYPKMIMPIMAYRFTKKKDMNNCPSAETDEIRKWITTVSLSERFSMKTNERYKTDIGKFVELAGGKPLSKDSAYMTAIKHGFTSESELIAVTATSGALPKAISNLISYKNKGYISWYNGAKSTTWNKKNDFESHHIYPSAFLKDQSITLNKESIVNRAYISKIQNIKIGKKDPKTYLSECATKNSDLDDTLKADFIPLWVKNESNASKYQQFLDERAELLLKLIDDNTF